MAGITAHSEQGDDLRTVWRLRGRLLAPTIVVAATGFLSLLPAAPRLISTYTPRVPIGLYELTHQQPTRGDLLAIDVSGEPHRLLAQSGALKPEHLLSKPLIGNHGDVVCRTGADATVDISLVDVARRTDQTGSILPSWSGCRVLSRHEILITTDHPLSFDSRFFGPLSLADSVGVTKPLLLLPTAKDVW